jgi:hypothetical protein
VAAGRGWVRCGNGAEAQQAPGRVAAGFVGTGLEGSVVLGLALCCAGIGFQRQPMRDGCEVGCVSSCVLTSGVSSCVLTSGGSWVCPLVVGAAERSWLTIA